MLNTACSVLFQFTPSRGGRQQGGHHIIWFTPFQFTPSRGGRLMDLWAQIFLLVSIHALARRATLRTRRLVCQAEVSIHALARRATLSCGSILIAACFNSRPRAEGDCKRAAILHMQSGFNSRPRAEGDSKSAQNASSVSRKNRQIAHRCANSLHKKLYLNRNIGQNHSEIMRRPLRISAYDLGMRRVRQTASSHFRPAAFPMKYRQTDSP